MIYILKQDGKIVGFGATPFVLNPGQTQDTFEGSEVDYAGRFRLVANKKAILADGVDQALVTVVSNAGVSALEVDVNGVTVNVPLTGGQGLLPPITAEVGGQVVIKPADETLFSRAGEGSLVIVAEEI